MLSHGSYHNGGPADEQGLSYLADEALRAWLSGRAAGAARAFRSSGSASAFHAACQAGHADALIALVFPDGMNANEQGELPDVMVDEVTAGAPDDLTLVRGIDPAAAAILHSFGVTQFSDIAAFTPEDVEIVSRALDSPRRISKECWIEQCALLAQGTLTAYAGRMGAELATAKVETPIEAEVCTPSEGTDIELQISREESHSTLGNLTAETAADESGREPEVQVAEIADILNEETSARAACEASYELSTASEAEALDDLLVVTAEAPAPAVETPVSETEAAGADADTDTDAAAIAPIETVDNHAAVSTTVVADSEKQTAEAPTLDLESAARSAMVCEVPAETAATAVAPDAAISNVINLAEHRGRPRRSIRRLRVAAAVALLALGAAGTYGLHARGYIQYSAGYGCSNSVFALAGTCQRLTSIGF